MTNKIGYIRVQRELRKMIIRGEYNIGDLLPSENKLSIRYGLSRMTIRHALKNLEIEGLISRHKGKGSIVRSKRKSYELLSRKGFTEIMKEKEIEIDTEFIQRPELTYWRENFYWKLSDEEILAKCIMFSRVRKIDGKPVMLEKDYISNINLPDFCSTTFINNSLFDTLLVKYDIEITGVSQKFRAIPASNIISNILNIEKETPVLEITRKLSTSNSNLFVYSFLYCNTDDFSIET